MDRQTDRQTDGQKQSLLPLPYGRGHKTRNATQPKRVETDASARSEINLRSLVIMTFHLLTPKVDRFVALPRGPLLPISINIDLFVFRMMCSHVWKEKKRAHGRTDDLTGSLSK